MIARLAWLELRQQVSGRVFWIVFLVSTLMVVGALGIDELRVGVGDEGARTGAAAVVQTHLIWSLFFLFTAAALVGEAVLRDKTTGFADLVRATPVEPRDHALGRFIGAFGAVMLCFASVPVSLAGGGAVLGLGSAPAGSYLFGFVAMALPNLLLASALFFALAWVTGSMKGCLVGAAGLLTLYGIAGERGAPASAVIEPFGFAALAGATHGWSRTRLDEDWPAFTGELLANRAVWLMLAGTLIALGTWLAARRGPISANGRIRDTRRSDSADLSNEPLRRTTPGHRPAWKIVSSQMLVRTQFEVRRIVPTPAFAALLMMGLAAATVAASRASGTPSTIAALASSFRLVPVVVVLFFAGELFWSEKEHNVAPIIAASPVNEAVRLLPKLLALGLALFSLAAASAAAGVATELVTGHSPALGPYLTWYVLPKSYEWLLLGALALFLQSIAPNKLAGWGYMVFYLIGSLALNKLGWQDPHYRFGGYPGAPLPPALSGAQGVGWYQLGWGTVAVAMIAVACRRGLRFFSGNPPRRDHGLHIVARDPLDRTE